MFAKFTGKHLHQGLFFDKVEACNFIKKETLTEACSFIKKKTLAEAWNFIKKETLAQVFSCELCEISKNTFSYRTLPWLLLKLLRINTFCNFALDCIRQKLELINKKTLTRKVGGFKPFSREFFESLLRGVFLRYTRMVVDYSKPLLE